LRKIGSRWLALEFAIGAAGRTKGSNAKTNSKSKFTCKSCGQNAWGKPELEILCKPCGIQMRAAAHAVVQSYEQKRAGPAQIIGKRKRGRPKGSKNKPKPAVVAATHSVTDRVRNFRTTAPRRRGRAGIESVP
jgi:hypothetical protein